MKSVLNTCSWRLQLYKETKDLGDLGFWGNVKLRGLMYFVVGAVLSLSGTGFIAVALKHEHGILADVTRVTAIVSLLSLSLKAALQIYQAKR